MIKRKPVKPPYCKNCRCTVLTYNATMHGWICAACKVFTPYITLIETEAAHE